MELTGLCHDHPFESATALCRRCGLEFCEHCVVFPFGAKKPLCKDCAIAISGIKSNATRPEMAPRHVRRRAKEFDKNVRAKSAPMPDPEVPTIVDTTTVVAAEPAEAPDLAPVPSQEPAPKATPPPPGSTQPADGIAPAVDWNNPFG